MALSREQERAAVIFLAAGAGDISLAGGAAMITHGLIDRTTKDLDARTRSLRQDVLVISARVSKAFQAAGYTVEDRSRSDALRSLLVTSPSKNRHARGRGRPPETVPIEIGADHQALPSLPSRLGPILDPYELGANKLLAVYDRTRPRDADDIARLVTRLDLDTMLGIADAKMVHPLDRPQLSEALRAFQRVPDRRFPFPERAPAVRAFMRAIADSVEKGQPLTDLGPYRLDRAIPGPADRSAR
ncbi:MAG: nucleotidyl transferase AbiEii/AbiGii toxin family protein [Actinomycetia bacterium]|nr:nucleotidyl transferase AbiEii/AbiGii toxin family protein [Actinomycetes bacterium]